MLEDVFEKHDQSAEVESLAAWEQLRVEVFANSVFGAWFAQIQPLVESGRREFCDVESERLNRRRNLPERLKDLPPALGPLTASP